VSNRSPKFTPPDTPIENYNQNVINWAFVTMKYDSPAGPHVNQYDPYYRYSVDVNINGQQVPHTWFTRNVDEYKVIQATGATKGTTLAITYVVEGKRKGLVAMYSAGPQVQRTAEQVEAELAAGLAKLQPAQQLLPPEQPVGPQPPQAPTPPASPAAPAPATPAPVTPPTPQPPAPAPAAQQQQMPPKEQRQPTQPTEIRVNTNGGPYTHIGMTDEEFETWKALWRDNAKCMVWAFAEMPNVVKALNLAAKTVSAANQRELATSASIETWKQLGRGRSPLTGAQTIEAFAEELGGVVTPDGTVKMPTGAETKDGALRLIDKLDLDNFARPETAIVDWLKYTAEPVESIKAWQHAGAIANLLGVDREVLIAEWDTLHLLNLTQAIWTYQGARDEGLTRLEAQELVATEHDIPLETMVTDEDDE
jgi:outer membrane biosynthesis protein TonB